MEKVKAEGKYTACEVADWFIGHVRGLNVMEDEEPLSLFKLQALLYYAQGCYIAKYNKEGHITRLLFEEPIYRNKVGVITKSVQRRYLEYRGKSITYDGDLNVGNLIKDKEVRDLLRCVYNSFGIYSTWGTYENLRRDITINSVGFKKPINLRTMRLHFMDHGWIVR